MEVGHQCPRSGYMTLTVQQLLPDDLAVLAGDMELEHVTVLHALNKLQRDLKEAERGDSRHCWLERGPSTPATHPSQHTGCRRPAECSNPALRATLSHTSYQPTTGSENNSPTRTNCQHMQIITSLSHRGASPLSVSRSAMRRRKVLCKKFMPNAPCSGHTLQ